MKEVKPEKGLEDTGAAGSVEELGAFSPEVAPGLTLVTLMRIYDVLMAMYRNESPEAARRLHELHAQGKIIGSLPFLDLEE